MDKFYAVDADNFPVWLEQVSEADALHLIEMGEAHGMMSAEAYQLVWTNRCGDQMVEPHWTIMPREERAALTIYV